MENFLYTIHPVRCIITRPSECGKSVVEVGAELTGVGTHMY